MPNSLEEYLAALPATKRAALEEVRKAIRAAAPEATEGISYQMPASSTEVGRSSATPRSRTTAASSR